MIGVYTLTLESLDRELIEEQLLEIAEFYKDPKGAMERAVGGR